MKLITMISNSMIKFGYDKKDGYSNLSAEDRQRGYWNPEKMKEDIAATQMDSLDILYDLKYGGKELSPTEQALVSLVDKLTTIVDRFAVLQGFDINYRGIKNTQ